MKQTNKILVILMAVLAFAFCSRAQQNLYLPKLQTDFNGGGHNITNVLGITGTNGLPITGGGGPASFATNANQTASIINVSGNYTVGSDTNLMLTTNIVYSVKTSLSNITLTFPPLITNSFWVENDGTGIVAMASAGGITFKIQNGTGNPVYQSSISNSYPMKVMEFGQLNSTNYYIRSENRTPADISALATTAAVNVVATNNLVELLHGTNRTYYTLIESAVSNAVYGDTVNLSGIINAYTNIPIPGGVTINFRGATVTNNVNLNSVGPLFQPTGFGATLNGPGSIYPAADHATIYHAAFGFNSTSGNATATNFLVSGLAMYGDSDVVFIEHTNYFSGYFKNNLISGLTNASWDQVVLYNTNNLGYVEFDDDQFYDGPVVSLLSGATLRGAGSSGVVTVYNGCQFVADGTIAASQGFSTQNAISAVSYMLDNNTFNNCVFTVLGTSASYGIRFASGGLTGTNWFNNCYLSAPSGGTGFRFQSSTALACTNYFNGVYFSGAGTACNEGVGGIIYNVGGNIRWNTVTTAPYNFVDETGNLWVQVTNGVPSIIPQAGGFIENTNPVVYISTNGALTALTIP